MKINHVSDKLSKEETNELSTYYNTYKRKVWAYKKHYKHYRRIKYIANIASVLIGVGSISSAFTFTPAIGITAIPLLIQAWKDYKNYEYKIRTSSYAYQTYAHLLTKIKDILRSGNYERDLLLREMLCLDDFIIGNSCIIDKWYEKYDVMHHHDDDGKTE